MPRHAQPGTPRPPLAGRPLRRFGLALALAGACWLTGCNLTGSRPPPTPNGSGDPIFGEVHPKGFAPTPSGPGPSPAPTKSKAGLPPYPSATSAGSLAAITGDDPLNTSQVVAIDDGKKNGKWARTTQEQKFGPAPGGNAGAALLTPQPIVEALPSVPVQGSQAPALIPATSLAAPPAAGSYDQLQAQLQARQVKWQRQETFANGFKFACGVPNPTNPDFERIYEATAPDYRSAIAAVLEQMDRER